ncbi:MAG: hypothetical protein ACKO86_14880, partial [Dolichospermum sp.]
WSHSLFEDNAEFGFGYRLSIDKQAEFAAELLSQLSNEIGDNLVNTILQAEQKTEADIWEQREKIVILKHKLAQLSETTTEANLKSKIQNLKSLADYLVKKSV